MDVLRRSLLGLVDVFNVLPPAVVEGAKSTKDFQSLLQAVALTELKDGGEHWSTLFSATNRVWQLVRLRRLRGWTDNRERLR